MTINEYVILFVCCHAMMAVAVACLVGMNAYSCDFERYGECGWEQSVHDSSDWSVRSAAITSNGPEVDHTFNASAGLFTARSLPLVPNVSCTTMCRIQCTKQSSVCVIIYKCDGMSNCRTFYLNISQTYSPCAPLWTLPFELSFPCCC